MHEQLIYAWIAVGSHVEVEGVGWTSEEADEAAIASWDDDQENNFLCDWEDHELEETSISTCEHCWANRRARAEFVGGIRTGQKFYWDNSYTKIEMTLPSIETAGYRRTIRQSLFHGLQYKLQRDGRFSARAVAHFRGSREKLAWCLQQLD